MVSDGRSKRPLFIHARNFYHRACNSRKFIELYKEVKNEYVEKFYRK
jgi:hypothetical protein